MLAMEAKNPAVRTTDSGKEIKVKIPVGYHIKLHTLKVLKGQSISDTVELALEKYFQTHTWSDAAAAAMTSMGHRVPVRAAEEPAPL